MSLEALSFLKKEISAAISGSVRPQFPRRHDADDSGWHYDHHGNPHARCHASGDGGTTRCHGSDGSAARSLSGACGATGLGSCGHGGLRHAQCTERSVHNLHLGTWLGDGIGRPESALHGVGVSSFLPAVSG